MYIYIIINDLRQKSFNLTKIHQIFPENLNHPQAIWQGFPAFNLLRLVFALGPLSKAMMVGGYQRLDGFQMIFLAALENKNGKHKQYFNLQLLKIVEKWK